MGPVEAIKTCLAKSFQFSGRATFPEFWWFAAVFVGGAFASSWTVELYLPSKIGFLRNPASSSLLVFLTLFTAPFIATAWRRNQDRGCAGVWVLPPILVLASGVAIAFLEVWLTGGGELSGFIGSIIGSGGFLILFPFVLISLAAPSHPGPNRYGPNPLEATP